MIKYSQYFTETLLAESVINLIPAENVDRILDLGIGNGSLSLAAKRKWGNSVVDAVDIDLDICLQYDAPEYQGINVKHGDVLSMEGTKHLVDGIYDLCICNPPFLKIKKNNVYDEFFIQANLIGLSKLKNLSADVIFIAQNIRFLKPGGILMAIIPDGLLTRHDYLPFRETLVNSVQITHVIQFPEKAFMRTEARTHVLLITKKKPNTDMVPISLMKNDGTIADTIRVKRSSIISRMDYSYLKWQASVVDKSKIMDYDFRVPDVIIKRGSLSYKDLRIAYSLYLHSNSFRDHEDIIANKTIKGKTDITGKCIARTGDFVLCRVGKRCVGKVAYIKHGSITVSDCLYIVNIQKPYIEILRNILYSSNFRDWVHHCSHGVCSKVISKCDLENYLTSKLKESMQSQHGG